MMTPSFFVIRDSTTGKYLSNKYEHKASADVNTECRLVSEANAHTVIRVLQSKGAKVDTLEVIPVALTLLPPIKANIHKVKPGFVIKFAHPEGPHSRGTVYWKGNKKKPGVDFTKLTWGPKSPETASIFATLAEASEAHNTFKSDLVKQRKYFDTHSAYQRDKATYLETIDAVEISIVQVS